MGMPPEPPPTTDSVLYVPPWKDGIESEPIWIQPGHPKYKDIKDGGDAVWPIFDDK